MNCPCPACGRTTRIESDLMDFFTRCMRCGVLLRPTAPDAPAARTRNSPDTPPAITAKIVRLGRFREAPPIDNGHLADVLSRPVRSGAPKPVVPAVTEAPAGPTLPVRMPTHIPRRAKSSRLASLQQHHHVLGIISLCGSGIIAMLAVCVLAFKAQFVMNPQKANADTVHIGNRTDSVPLPEGTARARSPSTTVPGQPAT